MVDGHSHNTEVRVQFPLPDGVEREFDSEYVWSSPCQFLADGVSQWVYEDGCLADLGETSEIRLLDDALMTFFNHLGNYGWELVGTSSKMEHEPIRSEVMHLSVLEELNKFPFSASVRYWFKRQVLSNTTMA